LAETLSADPNTVLISEDAWLGALYKDELNTGADYLRCSAKLKDAMAPHVLALLNASASVVLDFPANTLEQRGWMRELIASSNAPHTLHYLDVPDDVCLARLRLRNAKGEHPFTVSDAQFEAFSEHFAPPTDAEGFSILVHAVEK